MMASASSKISLRLKTRKVREKPAVTAWRKKGCLNDSKNDRPSEVQKWEHHDMELGIIELNENKQCILKYYIKT